MTRSTYWNKEEIFKRKQVISDNLDSIWIPALTKVDLEPSAKRGTHTTRTLVGLYWSPWSFHSKESPNQISHKSTKVEPNRSPQTWKKSNQIPKLYALQHIYKNKLTQNNQVNYWTWLELQMGPSRPKIRQSQIPLLVKKSGPCQNMW